METLEWKRAKYRIKCWHWKTAQWIRTLAAFAEELGSLSDTRVSLTIATCRLQRQGDQSLCPLKVLYPCAHTDSHN